MTHKFIRNLRIKEIIRFVITGGLSFLVDYGVMVQLTDRFGLYYLLSSGISFLVSVIINYYICLKWVFIRVKKQTLKSAFIFISTSLIGLFLNQFFMWLFVETIMIYYKFAKIIATLLVMIWNYFMKRKAVMT